MNYSKYEDRSFPTLKLVRKHDRISDYRKDDFELEDYNAHEAIKGIPVGV